MLDWTKQTEEALQSWADAQKRIWSGWAEAAGQQVNQNQLADTWRKAVDTWEEAVKNGLKAQLEWSQAFVGEHGDRAERPQGPSGLGEADPGSR